MAQGVANQINESAKCWSEWQDLNLRPPRPERGALPSKDSVADWFVAKSARRHRADLALLPFSANGAKTTCPQGSIGGKETGGMAMEKCWVSRPMPPCNLDRKATAVEARPAKS